VLELLPGGADHLLLRAHLPRWDELVHLVQHTRRIFNLDFELAEASSLLDRDPIIGPRINARPGLRPPGTWDGFETGVRAIIGQEVTLAGANTLTARLVEQFGTRIPGLEQLGLTHTFPSPSTLAEADFGQVGLTRTRAAAIRAFSHAVATNEVRLDRSITLDGFVASITALEGLGPWTAHYLALRLGERDACPTSDLALQRALSSRAPHSAVTLDEHAERWRPWRALAATHLWLTGEPYEDARRVRGAA
jgi:AraC family transcriptional regulator of adaptative response / DNA-3-methyladenine glycosylase II